MTAGFPDVVRQKICPRCGAQFGCGSNNPHEACWCDRLPHVASITDGADCFCPACLAANCDATQRNTETTTEARE